MNIFACIITAVLSFPCFARSVQDIMLVQSVLGSCPLRPTLATGRTQPSQTKFLACIPTGISVLSYIIICTIIDTNLHILIAHHASLLGCLWAQAPENHSDACGLLGIGPKHICAGAGELCVYTVLTLVILNEVWCCAGCANLNCLILFMASLREGRGHLKRLPFAGFCPPLEFKSSYPNTPSWVVAPQKIFNSQFLSPFT